MKTRRLAFAVVLPLCGSWQVGDAAVTSSDPRLREVEYDAHAVVTVPVKRGVVVLVELDADESISDVAAGLGGDCSKADAVWCIAAQPGGRHIFVKAKSGASASNNVAVVTDRRTHAFRFVVLADGASQQPVYQIAVHAPPPPARAVLRSQTLEPFISLPMPPSEPASSPEEVVAERMSATPRVVNASYSLAEGEASQDIVPTLVFDDGRFTYLKFPGNREVPAVFQVQGDGSEALVNVRMENDLLVVDRVSRRLMLRAGSAVVGLWNDAFDLDGKPPLAGTTVPGVRRAIRPEGMTPESEIRKAQGEVR